MIKKTAVIVSFLIGNVFMFYAVQAQKRKPASVTYSRQDRLQAEFRVLVHRAMKQLKEKYIGTVLVEKKFDAHMDKYLQAHIGESVYNKAKDSLKTILMANYIDKFKIKDEGEIDNLVQALFMEKSTTKGSKEPPIIETLNAIKKDTTKSTKDQETAVMEELERLLLSTWDLEVVSLMNKYQINIIPNPKTVSGTTVLPASKKPAPKPTTPAPKKPAPKPTTPAPKKPAPKPTTPAPKKPVPNKPTPAASKKPAPKPTTPAPKKN